MRETVCWWDCGQAGPLQAATAELAVPARVAYRGPLIFHSLRHFWSCCFKPAAGFQQGSLRLSAVSNCIYVLYPLSRINRLAINSSFLTSSWITRSLIIFSVAVNLKSCVTLSESFHSCVASAALWGNWQPGMYWQNRTAFFPLPGTSASSALPNLPHCCLENTYPGRWLLVHQGVHIEKQKILRNILFKNPFYLIGSLR